MNIATIAQPESKASTPRRISDAEAGAMVRECSLLELGRMAHEACLALHPEDYRTYVVDRNINYSNICTAHCTFCNFKARQGSEGAYVLSREALGAKIEELIAIGGTQVLLQGGLAPADVLDFEWYLDLLRFIKREYPGIHLHAFSPPEIWAFSKLFDMPVREVLLKLQEAGLDTIPGGGAEILVDRVRDRISVGKSRTEEYLAVMREAHGIGMRTSMTMMFGHIETMSDRIEHLRRVRELQDETGGFTAFICWTFQPHGTALGRTPGPPEESFEGDGEHLVLAEAHEYLKMVALARVYLDNVSNIQASWVTQGPQIGQVSLFFGANDMGSVMMEENVVSAAGTTHRLAEADIRRLIADAGWRPCRRNCYYELLE
ncbi:MAG: dehypoxanthine futalosine cyclase [Phycisphaerae bacterium]|nr:dehypoxanthine futalosine cyclase [Phycisphaerae bacterium]